MQPEAFNKREALVRIPFEEVDAIIGALILSCNSELQAQFSSLQRSMQIEIDDNALPVLPRPGGIRLEDILPPEKIMRQVELQREIIAAQTRARFVRGSSRRRFSRGSPAPIPPFPR